MFRSLFIILLAVLWLVSFGTSVTAQFKEIQVKLYADSRCLIILSDNMTLPAFDLTGACYNLSTLSEISQCNTDSGGFLVLNFQFWNNLTNCPKNQPVTMGFVSRGKPGVCSQINVTQGAITNYFWGTFICPTLSSDLSSLPIGEDVAITKAVTKAVDAVSTLVADLSPSKMIAEQPSKLSRREKIVQTRSEKRNRNGPRV